MLSLSVLSLSLGILSVCYAVNWGSLFALCYVCVLLVFCLLVVLVRLSVPGTYRNSDTHYSDTRYSDTRYP